MEYNQETVKRIRELMPLCMRKKVHANINKGVSAKSLKYLTQQFVMYCRLTEMEAGHVTGTDV
jgi:hypothetical protein